MQRPVGDVRGGGDVERTADPCRDAQRIGRRRRPAFSDREVERFGRNVILDEIRADVVDAGFERRGESRVRQAGRNDPVELSHQPVDTLGRQIELEQLDGNQMLAARIIRAKHRPERPRSNLMKNPKRPERVRRRGAGSFRVQ